MKRVTARERVQHAAELPEIEEARRLFGPVLEAVRALVDTMGHAVAADRMGVSRSVLTRALNDDRAQRNGCHLRAEHLLWAILADREGNVLEAVAGAALSEFSDAEWAAAFHQSVDQMGEAFGRSVKAVVRRQAIRNRLHRAPMRTLPAERDTKPAKKAGAK